MKYNFNFLGSVPFVLYSQHAILNDHLVYLGRKGYPCFTLDKDGCAEKNKGFEHPALPEETLTFLRKHFKPILKQFENQTGMKIQLS